MERRRAARFWDLCATGLSATCILHCLGFPLIAAALPVMSLAVDSHLLHVLMVSCAAPITLWVAWSETNTSRNGLFAAIALAGLALMLSAVTIPAFEEIEVMLTVLGGTMLGGAHLWRWLRRHPIPDGTSTANEEG